MELYDLVNDLSETTNVASHHPDVIARLMKYAEQARAELGDVDRQGTGQRPAGFVQNPVPQLLRVE